MPIGKQSWISHTTTSSEASFLHGNPSALARLAPSVSERFIPRQPHETSARTVVEYAESTGRNDIKVLGTDKQQLLSVVHEDDGHVRTCFEFPVLLLYFVLFSAMFQIHYSTSDIHVQESLLRLVLTKPAIEVTTTADIDKVLTETWTPLLQFSNPDYPGPSINNKLGRLRLIAGVSFNTARSPAVACNTLVSKEQRKHFSNLHAVDCYPEMEGALVDQATFNHWSVRNLQETTNQVDATIGMKNTWAPQWRNQQRSLRRPRLRKRHSSQEVPWRNFSGQALRRLGSVKAHLKNSMPSRAKSEIQYEYVIPVSHTKQAHGFFESSLQDLLNEEALVFTAHFLVIGDDEVPTKIVSSVYVTWIFSRGGVIYTDCMIISTPLEVRPLVKSVLGVWTFFLLVFSLKASMRLSRAAKTGNCCSELLQLEKLFEWTLLVTGWLILLFLILEWLSLDLFNGHLEAYKDRRKTVTPAMINQFDVSWYHKMNSTMQNLEKWSGLAQFTVAFYHIFLVVRLLIASSGHLRLAVVFNTLRRGFLDLVHLFMVLGLIIFAFVMAGHVLFGRRLPEFATVRGSMGYCFQMILQRGYEGDRLTEEDVLTATIWIWSFVLSLIMVVVNIVLAMIFGSYSEVQNCITEQDTIWHTGWQLWVQLRNLSLWVPNGNLAEVLGKVGHESVITSRKLQEMCPHMSGDQMLHLYDTVKLRMVTSLLQGQKNTLPEALASILLAVEDLRQGARLMLPGMGHYRSTHCWAEDQAVQLAKAAEAVEEKNPGPPVDVPSWVEHGLLMHLRRRQAAMDTLYLRLVQMDNHLQKRDIKADLACMPLREPEPPSRSGSKRLDPTLTGFNMKPLLTPGQGRPSAMAQLPRLTEKLTGTTLLERLGRAC